MRTFGSSPVTGCEPADLGHVVPAWSDLDRMETFGPVATIEVVADEDAAVDRANATS